MHYIATWITAYSIVNNRIKAVSFLQAHGNALAAFKFTRRRRELFG
jgi:hypothetical protein